MKKSILEVVQESAKGLFDIGLMDEKAMHTFDAICLPPVHKLMPALPQLKKGKQVKNT